ncbi:hypothetical protein C8J55DRAFT_492004 [Lentinula edodes]|uniref:Uncharacterized protein n=1 Tax=Lentinula lateritia TaxID=40482 RepID=A0A9W8ZZU3_9AGAR|nr:hypothetical protein C8J55DRAFT_492004 [Lentinula edodes]
MPGKKDQSPTVYINIPTNQFGIHWEYYCNCTPPQNSMGVTARCYNVKKPASPYFGRTYLGCGKTRKRYQWEDLHSTPTPPTSPTESEFPDSEQFGDLFNDNFTQALAELKIKDSQASIQPPSSVEQPILQDHNAFGKLLGDVPLSKEKFAFLQTDNTSAQKAAGNVADLLTARTTSATLSSPPFNRIIPRQGPGTPLSLPSNVEAASHVELRTASPLPPPTLEDVPPRAQPPGTYPPGEYNSYYAISSYTLSEEIAEAIRELTIGNGEGNATLSTELEQGLHNLTLSDHEGLNDMHMVWNEAQEEWQLPVAAYRELVAVFTGQDNVHAALDGTVHFIPDYAPKNTLSNGITSDNEYSGDELGDITLVNASMNVGSDRFKLTPRPFNADLTAKKGGSLPGTLTSNTKRRTH